MLDIKKGHTRTLILDRIRTLVFFRITSIEFPMYIGTQLTQLIYIFAFILNNTQICRS